MSGMVYKKFGFSTPFLHGYRELKIPIIDSAGNPAWPQLFPASRIQDLRDTVGPRHFSAQMMLEYIAPDRVRLDPGALQLYSTEFDSRTARIGDTQITGCAMYWDPSSGHRASDGSVCALVYRDDIMHHIFIHDILYLCVPDNVMHPLGYQCNNVIDFCLHHNIRHLYVETNGIGNALPEIMHDVATQRGEKIYVHKIVNTRNKENRILDAIEPILGTGHLYAHTRLQQTPLFSEMLGWSPIGCTTHDDGLDAVAGAIAATPVQIRPIGGATRIFNAKTEFTI